MRVFESVVEHDHRHAATGDVHVVIDGQHVQIGTGFYDGTDFTTVVLIISQKPNSNQINENTARKLVKLVNDFR